MDKKHAKQNIRKSIRWGKSCSNCRRRKVKCNFEIPCDRCITRNQAQTCTRDPMIFDGMLVKNEERELKFSRENETLKNKIKELQDTIQKLVNNKESLKSLQPNEGNDTRRSKFVLVEHFQFVEKESLVIDPMFSKDWGSYSTTISKLKRSFDRGFISETQSDMDIQAGYDTEDWLALKHSDYSSYKGEDLKSKCWQFELDKIQNLTKKDCDILINSGLNIIYLYPIIDRQKFMCKYNLYWKRTGIEEQHLSEKYCKSSDTYLFLSLMYSLLCLGIYQTNENEKSLLSFTSEDWEIYPKAMFGSSLEALYRGRFMTHPRIESIQTINIHRILLGLLSGKTLSNNLLCVSFYLSYKLGLHYSCDSIARNNMWTLLTFDWYDDHDRYPLSNMSTYTSFTPPSKWLDEGKSIIDWSTYFLNFQIRVSSLKRSFYYEQSKSTLKALKRANLELESFLEEVSEEIKRNCIMKHPNMPNESLQQIRFHTMLITYHEILIVNCRMSTFLTYNEWTKNNRHVCLNSATYILRLFVSQNMHLHHKAYFSICDISTFAAIFLIIDSMYFISQTDFVEKYQPLIKKTISVLYSFSSPVRGATRGIYVIKKMMLLCQQEFSSGQKKVCHLLSNSTPKILSDYNMKSGIHFEKKLPQPCNKVIENDSSSNTLTDISNIDRTHNQRIAKSTELPNPIMEILEDRGWTNFINSIDDLALSFDVNN